MYGGGKSEAAMVGWLQRRMGGAERVGREPAAAEEAAAEEKKRAPRANRKRRKSEDL